jgi:hypothetical protein
MYKVKLTIKRGGESLIKAEITIKQLILIHKNIKK